jgi:hypothetical protein
MTGAPVRAAPCGGQSLNWRIVAREWLKY